MSGDKAANSGLPHVADLRRKAEHHLHTRKANPPTAVAEADARALVHELQVHQIELEMQNEELQLAQAAAEEASERYSDLFDFAPVGCFLWDGQWADSRGQPGRSRPAGLGPRRGDPQTFRPIRGDGASHCVCRFLRRVLATDTKQTCKLRLLNNGQALDLLVEGIVAEDRQGRGKLCRAAVIDITQQNRADELAAANQALQAEIAARKQAEARQSADFAALTRMHAISGRLLDAGGLQPLLQEIMDTAVAIMGAARGTLQLLEGDSLRIVAHHGHQQPFLDFFASAERRASVCGEAMQRGQRVVVPDIETSPLFAGTPSLAVLREAGVRAVQSTPMTSRTGALLGILTTQWSVPYSSNGHDLWRIDLLVRQAADLIEHAKAEEALRESEERLRLAQSNANVGIWDWTPPSEQVTWGPELDTLYGVPPGTIKTYEDWRRRVHPDDIARAEAERDAAVAERRPFDLEFRILHGSGQVRWIAAKGRAIYGTAGEILRVTGVNIDITEHKRTEQQLFETNQRLQALMEAVPVGVSFSDDLTCQRVTGNPAMLAQFEVTPQDNLSASAPDATVPGRQVRFFLDGRQIADSELPLQRAVAENRVIAPMELEVRTSQRTAVVRRRVRRTGARCARQGHRRHRRYRRCHRAQRAEEEIAGLNQDLRRRVAELQAIFDTAPIGLAIADDAEGHHIRGNPANERILGVASGDELSKVGPRAAAFRCLLEGRELAATELPMQRAIRGETVTGQMMDVVRTDGQTITLYSSAAPLLDERGKPSGAVGAFLDVTPLKRAEEALRQSEEQFRLAIKATNDAIWDIDLTTGTVHWNETYATAFGRPPETKDTWQWWTEHIHSEDRDRAAGTLRAAIDGREIGWTCEYRFLRADGIWADIYDRAYIARDASGKALRVVGAMLDLTDRKRAEERLQESEQRFRTMADSIPQLAWMAQQDGYISWYNRRWYEYTGTTPEQMEGWGWQAVHDPRRIAPRPGAMEGRDGRGRAVGRHLPASPA